MNRRVLANAGQYTVSVTNGVQTDVKNFTLEVRTRPKAGVVVDGGERALYQVGHEYTLKCSATGHPLPTVHWVFKPCSGYGDCERSRHRPLKAINEEAVGEYTKVSVLRHIARESGDVTCQACNVEDCTLAKMDFFVTDVVPEEEQGFAVAGPQKAVEGEHVKFTCKASVYNYTR